MSARQLIRNGVFFAISLALFACDSSDEPTKTVPTDSGSTSPDSGKSPGSDASTVSIDAGRSTTGASGTVQCGAKTCTAPVGGMLPNVACCLPDNSCGAKPDLSSLGGLGLPGGGDVSGGGAGGTCLDVSPGKPDTSCPGQNIMGFAIAGCCSNAGVCGIDLTIGGLGCNSASALGGLASFAGGGAPVDAGPPQKCDGKTVAVGAGGLDAAAASVDASTTNRSDASTTKP